jgi:peroxiredoxin
MRHQVLSAVVLNSDAPSEAALTELMEGASNPAPTLERIWQAGTFSGHLFVVNHLRRSQKSGTSLVRQMEPVLEEAVWDADLETRETAFSVLAQQKNRSLRHWLHEQLGDADPAVRAMAVQQLARIANSNDVSTAIRLLDDPDPRVVAATGSLLKRVKGQDFGLKSAQALPRFAWKTDAPPKTFDLEAIQRGRDKWCAWWRLHESEFPADSSTGSRSPAVYPRPARDFSLKDTEGRTVRLSDFRGKSVLITFWNFTNSLSFVDEPALQALQQKQPQRLALLTIAVDPAVWPDESCGDHEDGHGGGPADGHEHTNTHCHEAQPDPAKTKANARALAARLGVRHPVLLDAKAALVARYGVHDLPAYVLIDPQGNLRRRFFGSRTVAVFEAMLKEITATDEPRASVTP